MLERIILNCTPLVSCLLLGVSLLEYGDGDSLKFGGRPATNPIGGSVIGGKWRVPRPLRA